MSKPQQSKSSAANYDFPYWQRRAARLRQGGKPAKVILCALMRKLLSIVWGILRSGKPFDPNHAIA